MSDSHQELITTRAALELELILHMLDIALAARAISFKLGSRDTVGTDLLDTLMKISVRK
jgi:hypothetical protein